LKARLLLFASLSLAGAASGQAPRGVNKATMLVQLLNQNHYAPRPIDDKFSRLVFDQFIENLDPYGLYFTEENLTQLKDYRLKLDNELNTNTSLFLPFATRLYKERLVQAGAISKKLLQTPFNFTEPETMVFRNDGPAYAANGKELEKRWKKYLKYKALNLLVHNPKAIYGTQLKPEAEADARRKVGIITERMIKRELETPEGFENMVQALYLNSIANTFDPHTLFLSGNELEDYKSGVSKEAFSFGLEVTENDMGEIEISQVVPGSPAWKSNELHKGDILVAIKPPGKSILELMASDADETQAMLDATQKGSFEFMIRKKNGLEKTVPLQQEKVESEQIVKSFLLTGDKKVGYISLPGFYSEWENADGLGCANDVAREILKLKQQGMEALILDIRFNGGGSVTEGTSLAGIFIDEGPLFMMQGKETKPYLIKDTNRGTIYDGPLVVLVNGQSASASELLAASLQDYNRALIVGSPTFGKATAQVVLPLTDRKNISRQELTNIRSDHGYSVVTVEKLYRVTGKTAQLQGVKPDITLPDPFKGFYETEADFETALPADSVSKKVIFNALAALPVKELQKRSKTRTSVNPNFQQMEAFSASDFLEKEPQYPLTLAGFKKATIAEEKDQDAAEKFLKATKVNFRVGDSSDPQKLLMLNTYATEINQKMQKQLEEDVYLGEAYQIAIDLIQLTQKP
jgi:carboxyl-terminal processing protease